MLSHHVVITGVPLYLREILGYRACLVGALSDEPEKKACLGGRKSIKCFPWSGI
jgi:hypothetical protein